ncbi:rRNA-processing protein bfr2 [Ceratobasidium sp. 392]|nr:rRNA-processing protein bfr2 [Ceratobasidium sp. 392]
MSGQLSVHKQYSKLNSVDSIGPTLAEQIAQLDDIAPPDVDIERLDGGLIEDGGNDRDLSAGRGHYLNVGASSMRKQRDALVDPKYDGARTSRSQLYEFDEGSDDEELEDGNDGLGSESEEGVQEAEGEGDESQSDGPTISSDEEDASGEDSGGPTLAAVPPEETTSDNLAKALKKSREVDKDKGRAIVQQRALWDSLVETRIRMQKAASASNRLPHPDHLPPYVTSEAGREAAQALVQEVLAFSEDLAALRTRLLTANEPEVQIPPPKRRKVDPEDKEEQTRHATFSAMELDAAYHPSCVRTLQKWSSKIAAVTPTLSSRGKSFRGGGASRSTVELVEDALGESGTKGGGKVVGRTRVRRSSGTRIAATIDGDGGEVKGGDVEGYAEVFDDLDFYQTLLRDVIDSRAGADGSEDWATRQRLKKAKKIVDTKASKGRKLRYEIHEKLQNFMVPVPTGTWHEEQIDELFANLFGRGLSGDRGIPV